MEAVLEFLKEIAKNWDMIVAGFGEFKVALAAVSIAFVAFIGSLTTILSIVYSVCLLIPGQHPDKEIEWLLNLTKKLSKK